jgi:hypothetical protein
MPRTVRRPAFLAAALSAASLIYACSDPASTSSVRTSAVPSAASVSSDQAGVHRQYGVPVQLGNGRARAYSIIDEKAGSTLELGIALDEQAMEGLRAPVDGANPHHDHDMLMVQLPQQHASAFKFVELDWNPQGHGDPYAEGHFDFHFYTLSEAEVHGITPSDPQYGAKAANNPPASDIPPFYFEPASALGIPADSAAVPMMGMHWLDVRSPELQGMLGNPGAYKPFTSTFIYGAWDGQLIFMEPMITRSHILAKRDATDPAVRDQVIPIPTSPSFPAGGFRPNAYRIAWDAQSREFRVALIVTGS